MRAKLQSAGVPVVLKRYDGMIHPFFSLAGIMDTGRVAIDDAGAAVRQALTVRRSGQRLKPRPGCLHGRRNYPTGSGRHHGRPLRVPAHRGAQRRDRAGRVHAHRRGRGHGGRRSPNAPTLRRAASESCATTSRSTDSSARRWPLQLFADGCRFPRQALAGVHRFDGELPRPRPRRQVLSQPRGCSAQGRHGWDEHCESQRPGVGGVRALDGAVCRNGRRSSWLHSSRRPGRAQKVLDIAAGHGMFGLRGGEGQSVGDGLRHGLGGRAEGGGGERGGARRRRIAITRSRAARSMSNLARGYDLVLVPNFLHHFDLADQHRLLAKLLAQ